MKEKGEMKFYPPYPQHNMWYSHKGNERGGNERGWLEFSKIQVSNRPKKFYNPKKSMKFFNLSGPELISSNSSMFFTVFHS